MWNPVAWLTGATKGVEIADKAVDGIFSGIDKLVFTNEEKADYSKQAAKIYLEHQKVTLGENTAKSITRRILAIMVMGTFLFLLLLAVAVYKFDSKWAEFSLNVAGTLSTGFTAIIVFYFGYYAIGNLMDKRNGGTK